MSLASCLYQLQSTELQLRDQQRRLQQAIARLEHNEELAAAQAAFSTADSRLKAAEKAQKELEWQVEDLDTKIHMLNDRLYSGSVRNPKELLNLEQEMQNLKKHLAGKEEQLLESMGETESLQDEAAALGARVDSLVAAWIEQKPSLHGLKETLEADISRLATLRMALRQEIGPQAVQHYEMVAKAKGLAMVRAEQGRCTGCNLTVPVGLWQRARAGEMVECSSCGRLLYVE